VYHEFRLTEALVATRNRSSTQSSNLGLCGAADLFLRTVASPNRLRLGVVCQLLRELVARETELLAESGAGGAGPVYDGEVPKGPLARVSEELMSCLYSDYSEKVRSWRHTVSCTHADTRATPAGGGGWH